MVALKPATGAPFKRLTGLQKDVLSLYRKCVRAAYKKEEQFRPAFFEFARAEFDKHRDLGRKDIVAVEYLLRTGNRKLEMFSNPNLRKIT